MIVKLQRPLGSSGTAHPWLAYNRNRSVQVMLGSDTIPAEIVEAMGEDPKGYFDADLAGNGTLTIGQRVSDQPW